MVTKEIQWEQYHHVWDQAQDDIERRVLYLGLRLSLDDAGWTLRAYKQTGTHGAAQMLVGTNSPSEIRCGDGAFAGGGCAETPGRGTGQTTLVVCVC